MGAMSELRKRFIMGLVLLMCTLTEHCGESAPSTSSAGADAHRDLRRTVEIVKQVEESRGRRGAKTEAPITSRDADSPVEQNDFRYLKTHRDNEAVVIIPREIPRKQKFITYLTGPLYFPPRCRKMVYRVYHHTRDCTIPAFLKRCARLLTRLAGSPRCTEG